MNEPKTHVLIWLKSDTLPDCMTICGTCEVKIPSSAGAIVPFYDINNYEKIIII
jgi:hypothetical protein